MLLDFVVLIGLGLFLSFSMNNTIYLFLFPIALMSNNEFRKNKTTKMFFIILAVLSFIYLVFLFISTEFILRGSTLAQVSFYALLIIYFIFIHFDRDKLTLNDLNKKANPQKILDAQIFFGIAIIILSFFSELAIGNIILYVSSIMGVVFYGLFDKFKDKKTGC